MPGPSDNLQVEVVGGNLTLDPTNLTLEATQLLLLAELETLNAIVGTAGDDAGDPTVIGLLKQIAANTAET